MSDKIQITRDDLYSPQVNDIIAEQEALQKVAGGPGPTPLWRRIVFSSLFFLSVAGALGGVIGWACIEPFFNEGATVWGKVEAVSPEPRSLRVRGLELATDRDFTWVRGRGAYADVRSVAKLKEGMPVRVQVFEIEEPRRILCAARILVADIPTGADTLPLPTFEDSRTTRFLAGVFGFAIVGACIAGVIAAADGFISRNLRRGALCAIVGIGIAVGGGLVGLIPAGILLGLTSVLTTLSVGQDHNFWFSSNLTGGPLLMFIIGRALAWGVFGLCIGLGQGAALRSKKLAANGLLGGLLGAMLGGMFFDPIDKLFAGGELGAQAIASRFFGFTIIGLCTGFMIGLVEHLAKEAWLLMRAGPLAGKQFVIYKSPTVLGSSPKSEVYLFKDPAIEPRHALVRKVGNRHEIEDQGTPSGTFVNGKRITRMTLKNGDQITLGQTVLEYSERPRGAS